ncbi:MAG TPA: bile acid:sodium symporter family protein, partial [Verrucomicrobiota bacterium]|nr:bile acid:sodium symporter family protein [Verrucomicrobiota bacterium]
MSDHALMAAIGGMDTAGIGRLLAVLAAIALAIGLRFAKLRGYQFTAWIIVAVVSGMLYPERVLKVGEFDMR